MRRKLFTITFIAGLLMCFFAPYIFYHIIPYETNQLVFFILITVFGGAGLIVDIYKK